MIYYHIFGISLLRSNVLEIVTLTDRNIFASNCYILLSEDSFSVVDPSVSFSEAAKAVPKLQNLKPGYVLLTHGHIDHMWHIYSYTEIGCEVLVSHEDAILAKNKMLNCAFMLKGNISAYTGKYREVFAGDKILIGNVEFEVIATPGHTEGSVCYLSDEIIFTGDTIFSGGAYGRYDLPTGNFKKLRNSLNKLLSLNGDLRIYSGHGESTTLNETKLFFI